MLRLKDVEVFYGRAQALRGISMEMEEGELVAILGANGAGKTTLLRTISGLTESRKGTIEFLGKRIDNLPPEKIVHLGISHCPEGRKLFPQLTVFKNLILGAYVRRHERKGMAETMDRIYELFPVLKERQEQLAGTLSGGEQQMLTIARALMARPILLMLDEPSLGIAPLLVNRIFEVIKEINQQGTAILLVEQNAALALNVAHRGYVLETGEVVLVGPAQGLLNEEKVKQAYMGI
ncbi:MAG: ABC transporter ATP-binding protein [Thermodesulfobacteriota bacterium]